MVVEFLCIFDLFDRFVIEVRFVFVEVEVVCLV